MRRAFFALTVMFVLGGLTLDLAVPGREETTRRPLHDPAAAGQLDRSGRGHPMPEVASENARQGSIAPAGASSIDTILIAEFSFDDEWGEPDPQGWVSVDRTAQLDTFFHVADAAELNGGGTGWLVPLQGMKSLWCGVAPNWEPELCGYATIPGYGNSWVQIFESKAFPVAGNVSFSYQIRWDSEPGYDFTFVECRNTAGEWIPLPAANAGAGYYDGVGEAIESFVITPAWFGDTLRLRFRFVSDVGWSDEDGLWDTDGAVLIDSITVFDGSGLIDYQDFEGESSGAKITLDGDWVAKSVTPFGDYAGLFEGATVLQEDAALTNATHLWGFFRNSPDDYACGGHPEQAAVPFTRNPGSRISWDYIDNEVWSPWIDLTRDVNGDPVIDPIDIVLAFDVYRDLPLNNLVFYKWAVRFKYGPDDCPTKWVDRNFVYYSPNKKWFRHRESGLDTLPNSWQLNPRPTQIQIAVGAVDMCPWWCGYYGTGACHSHAPLIDNVALYATRPGPFVVTNTNDTGPGSLHQAIQDANASPGYDVIAFDIPGAGPHVIQLSGLLQITSPLMINGYSQPGSSRNTAGPYDAGNEVIQIEIDGSGVASAPYGLLWITADSSIVRGLSIGGSVGPGIGVESNRCVIEGNHIGIGANGTAPRSNLWGIAVFGDSTRVGGIDPAARNVISGNVNGGVWLHGSRNVVKGNFIGTTANGADSLTDQFGVYVEQSFLPPGECSGNEIGGVSPGEGNLIAFNSLGVGVVADAKQCRRNAIRGNRIAKNSSLGIDLYWLGSPGPTPNDFGDWDFGPNDFQNYPEIYEAALVGDSTRIRGYLTSGVGEYLIDFYYNTTPCGAQGERYLGTAIVSVPPSLETGFDVTVPGVAPAGSYISATATTFKPDWMSGNTSEFGELCSPVLNTGAGSNVTTTPVDSTTGTTPVTVTFDNVSAAGNTTLATSPSGPPLPGSFSAGDSTYYAISTTATYTDSITICINYDASKVTGSESGLRLLHFDTTLTPPDWMDVTRSLDTLANVICGRTATLSPFAVALPRTGTSVRDHAVLPASYALHPNVPNPFNPTTRITFDVAPAGGQVTLVIYDVSGRSVRTLVDGFQTPGRKTVDWNGRSDDGRVVASGIYFCRMQAAGFVMTRKMVFLK